MHPGCSAAESHVMRSLLTGHLTKVVGPNLKGLFLPHEQPDLPVLLALQQADLPHAPLLPLPRVVVKAVQLAFPAHAGRQISLPASRSPASCLKTVQTPGTI